MHKRHIAAVVSAGALASGVLTATTVADATSRPAALVPAASHTLNAQDQTYIHDDAQGNLLEVRAGRLAARKGKTRAVRQFGRRMVRDHTREYASLRTTAGEVGYASLPTAPSAEQQHLISLWRGLSKRAFDRAYIGYEWEDHQLDISDAQDEVQDGGNATVQQDARESLPMLETHLTIAQRILMHLKR